MLIKRVYEIDRLPCPECGGQMKVIAFIEPLQGGEVIETILRHCGLWHASRAPPGEDGGGHDPAEDSDRRTAASDETRERMFVDIDTFDATF